MAQRVQVILVDDIDGGDAVETVSFALDGTAYEVDLSANNAAHMREALSPWVEVARKVTSSRSARSRRGGDAAKIRAWAKEHGMEVSERGRVSASVRDAYNAAH